jgi:transposase
MNQVTVFSGAQRQRRWSEGEKRAMVEAAFAQGAIVSVVAQRFDVAASQLYRWRRIIGELDRAASLCDFAPLVVCEDAIPPVARTALPGVPAPVMIVEAGGARVEIMAAASPKLVSATLAALKR